MNQQEWEALGTLHPSWRIRPTARGAALMATRLDRRHLTPEELAAGLAMTLIEDTGERLAEALVAQREIEADL